MEGKVIGGLPSVEEARAYADGYEAGLSDAKDQDVARLIVERDAAQARWCYEKVLREIRDRELEEHKARAGERGSALSELAGFRTVLSDLLEFTYEQAARISGDEDSEAHPAQRAAQEILKPAFRDVELRK